MEGDVAAAAETVDALQLLRLDLTGQRQVAPGHVVQLEPGGEIHASAEEVWIEAIDPKHGAFYQRIPEQQIAVEERTLLELHHHVFDGFGDVRLYQPHRHAPENPEQGQMALAFEQVLGVEQASAADLQI